MRRLVAEANRAHRCQLGLSALQPGRGAGGVAERRGGTPRHDATPGGLHGGARIGRAPHAPLGRLQCAERIAAIQLHQCSSVGNRALNVAEVE